MLPTHYLHYFGLAGDKHKAEDREGKTGMGRQAGRSGDRTLTRARLPSCLRTVHTCLAWASYSSSLSLLLFITGGLGWDK